MIKDIIDMNGIQPQVRELLTEMNVDLSSVNSAFASHSKAMSGDVVIAVDPATCGSSAEAVNAANAQIQQQAQAEDMESVSTSG